MAEFGVGVKRPSRFGCSCIFWDCSFNLHCMAYYVYMLASRKGGTIYTGVTNDLEGRVFDHREGRGSKFTSKYQVKRLVWYEEHSDVGMAIRREKNIKKYYRKWKIDLIEEMNPDWFDLYRTLNW